MIHKIPVCILTPSHFSSRMGGAEYQVRLLIDALCRTNRYELFYVCRRADKNYMPKGYQIRVVNESPLSNILFSLSEGIGLYEELKKIRPSIIYQRVAGMYTGVGAYYAKKHGSKFILQTSSDDDIVPQWKTNLKRSLRTFPERVSINYGIKNATYITTQTKFQADLLKKKFGISCKAIIPNGHPFPIEEPIKTAPLSVLWIANLKPLKRPELFVRLARQFIGCNDARFIMIGRQGWGKWFEKLKKEIQTLPNLEYVGELTQDQVNQHLSRGNILVNTSLYEGFSILLFKLGCVKYRL